MFQQSTVLHIGYTGRVVLQLLLVIRITVAKSDINKVYQSQQKYGKKNDQ